VQIIFFAKFFIKSYFTRFMEDDSNFKLHSTQERKRGAPLPATNIAEDSYQQNTPGNEPKKYDDAFWNFCKDSSKVEEDEINEEVSWKEVEWDLAREAAAKKLLEKEEALIESNEKGNP
jgi:hypothetical protein